MALRNLFKRIKKRFARKVNWKAKFPDSKHIIEEAFEVGGVQYYQFTDVFQIPYERALYALSIYEETRMKCSLEYISKHVEVTRSILKSDKIDIFKINMLNEQLGERLKMSFDVDLLYKLASIVFFTEQENPALYDQEYCKKKIEFWKKHKGVADFFLQQPLRNLIPYLDTAEVDFDTYSRLNTELNEIHSELLSM